MMNTAKLELSRHNCMPPPTRQLAVYLDSYPFEYKILFFIICTNFDINCNELWTRYKLIFKGHCKASPKYSNHLIRTTF